MARRRTTGAGAPRTGRHGDAPAQALAAFTRDTAGRGNWGHPGLAKILKDVGVEEALWTPAPDVHSIWEELNHIVYWSRFTLDYLEGRATPTGQAWPAAEGGEPAWRRAIASASRLHAAMARRVASLDGAALAARFGLRRPTRYTTAQLILGCAAHIAYHVGQIAVLKRLYAHARPAT